MTHTYAIAGDYTVKIKGNFPRIYFNNTATNRSQLLSIDKRGNVQWTSMEGAFYGANSELVVKATDVPLLTGVASMQDMFRNIPNLTGNFNNWNAQ